MKSISSCTLLLALLLPLAGCNKSPQATAPDTTARTTADTGGQAPSTLLSRKIRQGIDKAKQELASKNIDVNNLHMVNGHRSGDASRPDAEITPQGELLISGKPVAATPAQHALLLDYRQQLVGIAEAGMDIGAQGADIGIEASKAALVGAFSGKTDKEIEASIKPQTDKIQAAAFKLCKRLPQLLASQQKLAAEMPAFRPYATMEQKDIDDCGKNVTDKDGKKGFAIFSD